MAPSRRPAGGTLVSFSAFLVLLALGAGAEEAPATYVNPIVRRRADPWVYRHTDGNYYFAASVPEYDRIELRRAGTRQELGSSLPLVIWKKHESGVMSANWSLFSLDATEFEHRRVHYLVWAQKDPRIPGNNNLLIAAMSNPWTISGTQVRISKPEQSWEKIGYRVNEGPAVLIRNGRIFITYSASATGSAVRPESGHARPGAGLERRRNAPFRDPVMSAGTAAVHPLTVRAPAHATFWQGRSVHS